MAWNRGNLFLRIPFASLNGTSCRIDIYMRGYTGEQYFNVLGADNPFFYEENEDSDLLNEVLRYRTGYIRVVEELGSPVTQIYPTEPFDRYVEVYYGATLVFNGYIQVQDFTNEQVPTPRVIELPVISPLGLVYQKIFSNIMPPQSQTLGQLLNNAAVDYSYVCFPKRHGYPNPVNMGMQVLSLVVSPWNENFHYSMNTSPGNKVMIGESYASFIEAICKAFGWIAHDTPDTLVFTCFDYEDTYVKYPVGHIGEAGYGVDVDVPAAAVDLTDYFENADDSANIQTLQPDTGIEIKYEGDSGTRTFGFEHTYVPENDAVITDPSLVPPYNDPDEINSLCNLLPVPQLYEFSYVGQLSFTNDGYLNTGQGCCAWNGQEGVMISLSGAYPTNHDLFKVRYYIRKRSGQSYKFSYNMKGNTTGKLQALANYAGNVADYYITYNIDTTNQDYVEVTFKYRWGGTDYPQLGIYTLIFITNMKLDVYEDSEPYAEYRYKPAGDSDILPNESDPNPSISSSITMPISLYRMNDHLIGNNIRSTKLTTYPYLFQPRKQYVGKFRLVSAPTFPHVRLFNYLNKKWRIIAERFDPWNDEVKLTMQHSPVL